MFLSEAFRLLFLIFKTHGLTKKSQLPAKATAAFTTHFLHSNQITLYLPFSNTLVFLIPIRMQIQ